MSTTFGPPIILAGPLPQPLPFGLFTAATIVSEGDARWGNGANVRPYPSALPTTWDPCAAGTFRDKEIPEQPEVPRFSAFGVLLADLCAARGRGTDGSLEDRVRAAFAATEQWAVEREFATGERVATNPYLADPDADVLAAGAAQTLRESIALLEAAIAATGRAGIIHADRPTVSAWSTIGALRVAGDRLLTYLGTPVAAGGGYAGATPDGEGAAGADQGWAYATGPVEIRRGEIEVLPGSVAEALDRSVNEILYIAERPYLVEWDTQLQAAVLVDRSS